MFLVPHERSHGIMRTLEKVKESPRKGFRDAAAEGPKNEGNQTHNGARCQ